jgi:glucosamine-6-phosphate isomerase
MKTIVYPNYRELSVETARQIAQIIAKKPDALLCFPAGKTSLGTFAELVKLYREGKVKFSQCKIVGLDEWVHLGEMKNENCYHYLRKHLLDLVDIKKENICFFNGETDDLQYECSLSDQFIKTNGGIDLMVLGVGMNGHIALNEPGTSFDKYSHIVELDVITKRVARKYFSANTVLSQGITLGMKHIIETKTVILQVSGHKKSDIVKRLLETEITTEFPASLVKQHPNSFLLLDSEASL